MCTARRVDPTHLILNRSEPVITDSILYMTGEYVHKRTHLCPIHNEFHSVPAQTGLMPLKPSGTENALINLMKAPGKEAGHEEVTGGNRNHRSLVHKLLLDNQLLR